MSLNTKYDNYDKKRTLPPPRGGRLCEGGHLHGKLKLMSVIIVCCAYPRASHALTLTTNVVALAPGANESAAL